MADGSVLQKDSVAVCERHVDFRDGHLQLFEIENFGRERDPTLEPRGLAGRADVLELADLLHTLRVSSGHFFQIVLDVLVDIDFDRARYYVDGVHVEVLAV